MRKCGGDRSNDEIYKKSFVGSYLIIYSSGEIAFIFYPSSRIIFSEPLGNLKFFLHSQDEWWKKNLFNYLKKSIGRGRNSKFEIQIDAADAVPRTRSMILCDSSSIEFQKPMSP